jgi:hypothetical protein
MNPVHEMFTLKTSALMSMVLLTPKLLPTGARGKKNRSWAKHKTPNQFIFYLHRLITLQLYDFIYTIGSKGSVVDPDPVGSGTFLKNLFLNSN